MTREDFISGVEALTQAAQVYRLGAQQSLASFAISTATPDVRVAYPMILAEDWAGLLNFSDIRLADLKEKMLGLAGKQSQVNTLANQLNALKPGFKQHYPEPQTQTDWPARKSAIEAEFANQGIAQDITIKYVSRLGSTGGLNAFNYEMRAYNLQADILTYAYERHLAHFMYHFHSRSTAKFNIAVSTASQLPSNLSSKIYSLRNSIAGRSQTVFNKLKSGNIPQTTSRLSSFQIWLDSKFDDEIIPVMAASHQERASAGATFVTDGKRDMAAGDLFREAMFAQASILWLQWTIDWTRGLKLPDRLLSSAGERSFSAVELRGQELSIADLVQQGPDHDGTDVIISGVIANIDITHVSRAKAKSTADIVDGQGRAVTLVLPYIKIDSGGLVDGCYANLSGRFLVTNPESAGNPAISVDRLPMKSLAENSWSAWLRHRLRTVYQPVAHNLAVAFSAETGSHGLVNPLKYDTTYIHPKLPKFGLEI